jgi:hypothetical protein
MAEEKPQIVGTVVLAYLAEVEQLQLLDRVAASSGAELRQVIAKPPLAISWVDAKAMAQLADAVAAIAGESVVSKISYAAMRRTVGPRFANIARASIEILGATPGRLFKTYHMGTQLSVKGFSFAYERDSDTSGRMTIAASAALSPAYWITWEGPLAYMYEQCGVAGTVERDKAGSSAATFRLRWSA